MNWKNTIFVYINSFRQNIKENAAWMRTFSFHDMKKCSFGIWRFAHYYLLKTFEGWCRVMHCDIFMLEFVEFPSSYCFLFSKKFVSLWRWLGALSGHCVWGDILRSAACRHLLWCANHLGIMRTLILDTNFVMHCNSLYQMWFICIP